MLLVPTKRVLSIAGGAVVIGLLLVESMAAGTSWSPYYKITTKDVVPGNPDFVDISVNGIPHQPMARAHGSSNRATAVLDAVPADQGHALDDVLIVGAGSGNDVAIALRRARPTSTPSRSTRGSCRSASSATPTVRTRARG